jgi:hypothetical protein
MSQLQRGDDTDESVTSNRLPAVVTSRQSVDWLEAGLRTDDISDGVRGRDEGVVVF